MSDFLSRLSRMVGDDPGQVIGERAVEMGLITLDQLKECQRLAAKSPGIPFRKILEDHLRLAPQALDVLDALVRHESSPKRLSDRYEIKEEVGRGAMGIVYRAWDHELKRQVAIKMLRSDIDASESLLNRVRREATLAARLNHPNIPAFHDLGKAGGLPFLVMAYVEGTVLKGPIEAREAATLVRAVALAVQHAHAQGLIHRDIKPGNILVDRSRSPYVLDFGLARLFEGESKLTRSGAAIGTPAYMSPEAVRGDSKAIDERSDVYGLGATLWEALTGRAPFHGDTVEGMFSKILKEDPVSPSRENPAVPAAMDHIVLKAMEKDVTRRYRSAQEMADDLGRFLRNEDVHAGPVTWRSRTWRSIRSRPMRAAVAVAVFVLVIGAILGYDSFKKEQARVALALQESESKQKVADRVRQITDAYGEMSFRTIDAMRALEDGWYGVTPPRPPNDLLKEVEGVAVEVQGKYPLAKVPKAWLDLAAFYAHDGEAIDRLKAADTGDDPFPLVCMALALLSRYAADVDLSFVNLTGNTTYSFEKPADSAKQVKQLQDVKQALDRAGRMTLWNHFNQGRDYRIYMAGALDFGMGHFKESAEQLARLKGHPLLGSAAAHLRGLALFFMEEFEEAAAAFEEGGARGWYWGHLRAGIAYRNEAFQRFARREGPFPFMDRALASFEKALAVNTQVASTLYKRGILHIHRGELETYLGREEAAAVSTANSFRDFAESVRLEPDSMQYLSSRAKAAHEHGLSLYAAGKDPVPFLEMADGDLDRALAKEPQAPGMLTRRGLVNFLWAMTLQRDGKATVEAWERALKHLDAALERRPDAWDLLSRRGHALNHMERYDEALATYEKSLKLNPTQPEVRQMVERIKAGR